MRLNLTHSAEPKIKRMWQEAPSGMSFFSKLWRITRFYRGVCKAKARALRTEEDALIAELEALTLASQANLLDATLLHDRGECRLRCRTFGID